MIKLLKKLRQQLPNVPQRKLAQALCDGEIGQIGGSAVLSGCIAEALADTRPDGRGRGDKCFAAYYGRIRRIDKRLAK